MDRPTSTSRSMLTWAVAPASGTFSTDYRPSSSSGQSSDSSDEDTFRQTPRGQDSSRRITYKPSFVKATFQWMKGDLIGSGSYGRVFMALNATTGDLMAVKQVEIPKTSSDKLKEEQMETMKALRFEGETLQNLNHRNVVSYLGFEESQNYLSIFLEYVAGGTVGSLLRDHWPLREEVNKTWLGQILEGLDYLHSRGIIHRDLKADNILVDYSGTCKISDFGISKKASEMTRLGKAYTQMKGTIYWMAPEVLASTADGYDVKVDIWSVGCVAVEMWTGKRPWHPLPFPTVMIEVGKHQVPPPIPDTITISSLAENFREQCFHADPTLRPHASELKKDAYILDVRPGCTIQLDDITDKPARFQPGLYVPPLRASRSVASFARGSQVPTMTVRSAKPPLPNLMIPSWNQSLPATQPTQLTTGRQGTVGVPPESPRLVTITPLPSSGQKSSRNDELNPASATSADTPRHRRLVISNPDNDPPPPAFIFTPPPLPEPPRRSATISPRPLPSYPSIASTSMAGPSSASASASTGSYQSRQPSRRPSGDASIRSPPRPLPPSPASIPPVPQSPPPPQTRRSSQHSKRPGSSRDRSQTLTAIDVSSLKLYEEGNPAAKSVYNLSSASSSTLGTSSPARSFTSKRLPISPQPISTSLSTTASGSAVPPPSSSPRLNKRMVSRQKSVPDVSIFSYDPTNPRSQRNLHPRTYDSDDHSDTDGGSPHSLSHSVNLPKRHESIRPMRPRTEEIIESLEQFFPNRDLDQPVVPAEPVTPRPWDNTDPSTTFRRDASMRKSIRAIAREHHRLSNLGGKSGSSHRQTMLWNSHMQELK